MIPWPKKVKIWELHYLKETPKDRIRRELATGPDGIAPSWNSVRRVVKEFPSLSQAQVRQLPDALQERWRELQSEAEQPAPKEAVIRQEPYGESLHKQKLRERADRYVIEALKDEAYAKCVKGEHSWFEDGRLEGIAYRCQPSYEVNGLGNVEARHFTRTCFFCGYSRSEMVI